MYKKSIFKSLLLISLLVLIAEIADKAIALPYYWGNDLLNTKIQFLTENDLDPKNYFIGSSVTYRQTMPSVFDSLANHPKHATFNLAADGAMPPQTFYVFDHLIEQDTSIDYIFFELNSYDDLNDRMFHSTRSKYYYQTEHLLSSWKYLTYSSLKIPHKIWMSLKYTATYFEKLFKIGMRQDYLKYTTNSNVVNMTIVGEEKDGFAPFPNTVTRNERMKARLPDYIEKQRKNFTTVYQNMENLNSFKYNKELSNRIIHQIQKANKKNIKIIYILNPVANAFDNATEIVALLYSLPPTNRIDLANPLKYPEFYQIENRWDEGHLNASGAKIFSEKLGIAFNELPR